MQDVEVSNSQTNTPVRAGQKRSPAEREEMVMRKKLRNRESAQRARDRQKAKMRWLEEELQRVKIKSEQLLRENLILRHMVTEKNNNSNSNNANSQQVLANAMQTQQNLAQNPQTTNAPTAQSQATTTLQSLPKTGTTQIRQQAAQPLRTAPEQPQTLTIQQQQQILAQAQMQLQQKQQIAVPV